MPGPPHDGRPASGSHRVRESLRALHIEDDRLTLSGSRQYVARVDDEQVIAPHNVTLPVHDADPVGVAVERDTEVVAAARDFADEILEVLDDGRVGMMVRERAIALAEQVLRL